MNGMTRILMDLNIFIAPDNTPAHCIALHGKVVLEMTILTKNKRRLTQSNIKLLIQPPLLKNFPIVIHTHQMLKRNTFLPLGSDESIYTFLTILC